MLFVLVDDECLNKKTRQVDKMTHLDTDDTARLLNCRFIGVDVIV